ncbi:ABC transporter permease [Aridibaculum aurantiacum]|uniref:ABC transporter permease n=1 Tax=Aridibaculum aurantiacum TaxID=2810307 RepID=UPI001A9731D6|nr:ABC transporter permease subunit [Aridibaculum aurantiacum]
MKKLIKYVIIDIVRNKIVIGYTIFLLLLSFGMFSLEDNSAKGLLSLMNVSLLIVPLLSIIFSTIYVYNSAEFIELLVSQPVKRTSLISSLYTGLTLSLIMAVLVGIGLPVLIYDQSITGLVLVISAILLTAIFVALALLASVITRDKAKGIGVSILLWFYFSIIFDALLLFIIYQFSDYPLEQASIALTALNPIDLSRILVLLQMDMSAMMGYTGAVFADFFTGWYGYVFISVVILLWIISPTWLAINRFNKKDL